MLSEQQQRIMGYFIEEAKDHLNTIEQGLLNLQGTIEDPEMVNEVFRAAHSVKGGAAMLGLTSIQHAAHRLEDYFKILKECPVEIDQSLETLFLKIFDALQALLEQLQGPFGLTDDKSAEVMAGVEPIFQELNRRFSGLIGQMGDALLEDMDLSIISAVASVPLFVPLKVSAPAAEESALQLIFQSDVPVQLREMLQLFKQKETADSRQKLQSLCSVLGQYGDPLDLSEWCRLLEDVRSVIVNPENSYRVLAPIIIKEVKQAQELVLSGRSNEILASNQLIALLPLPNESDVDDLGSDFADLLGSMDLSGSDFGESDDALSLFGFDNTAPVHTSLGSIAASAEADLDLLANDDWFNDSVTQEKLRVEAIAPNDSSRSESEFESEFSLNFNEADFSTSTDADFSLANQSSSEISPSTDSRTGPEVGVAELNSLADLFEGEMPDLDLTWQTEEVISDIYDTTGSANAKDQNADGEFSDLLFDDPDPSDDLILDDLTEEDLSGLLDSSSPPPQEHIMSQGGMTFLEDPLDLAAIPSADPFGMDWIDSASMSSDELVGMELTDEPDTAKPDEQFELNWNDDSAIASDDPFALNTEQTVELGGLESLDDASPLDFFEVAFPEQLVKPNAADDSAFNFFAEAPDMGLTPLFNEEISDFAILSNDSDNIPELIPELPTEQLDSADGSELSFGRKLSEGELDELSASIFGGELEEAGLFELTDEDSQAIETALPLNLEPELEAAENEFTFLSLDDLKTSPDNEIASFELAVWETRSDPEQAVSKVSEMEAEISLENFSSSSNFESQSQPHEAESFDLEDSFTLDFSSLEESTELNFNNLIDHSESDSDLFVQDTDPDSLRIENAAVDDDSDSSIFSKPFVLSIGSDTSAGSDANEWFTDKPDHNGELASVDISDIFAENLGSEVSDPLERFEPPESEEFIALNPTYEATEALDELAEMDGFSSSISDFMQAQASADSEAEDFSEFGFELASAGSFEGVAIATPIILEPEVSAPDDFSELDLFMEEAENSEPFSASDPFSLNFGENFDEVMGKEESTPLSTASLNQPDDSDDFSDLEAMLGEPKVSTAAYALSEPEPDNFDDLDALLSDAPPTTILPVEATPNILLQPDEFGDLEDLLKDADQTLGGSSANRKAAGAPNRRSNRRGVLADQTMRVSVKHLDNLNNLVGEMVVNRNSLEQAQERLRQFLDNLLYQVQQLSDVGQRMRELYERSLLESSLLSTRRSYHLKPQNSSGFSTGLDNSSNHETGESFDALEMDRFTGFHTLSQEMIELIVRVRESASDIDFVVEESDQVTRNFRQITTQLQEGLTRARMVPFAQTADRLPRGVRDNALKYGKQAELLVEGRDTLIDKMIVEHLYDPMTHLVNNAVAHGVETAAERIAAGKPPLGKIVLRTFHQGNQTIISVSDDGAGIDQELVKSKAIAKGLITAAEAKEMSRMDTYDLLFHHGFSTADQIDDLKGRGVGLDVVRSNLNEIRGVISIDSTVGKGTTFTIRLPLTLSISKALCCISNRARIAFPMDGVEDMLDVPKERVQIDAQGRPCIYWRDALLPFQPLTDLLKHGRILGRGSVYGGNQEDDIISIVVLRSTGNNLALQVDQVLGEQEIVIKQLEGPVPKPIGIAGATVMGDGRIMPIADVLELIDLAEGRVRRDAGSSLWEMEEQLPPEAFTAKTEPTVLIVDDSITVRELLSMTFNKVGYRVEQARDGQEAWEKLRSGLPCDLVFCDIEMPRMDGLELLSRLQKDPTLSHLPIAMLTSRGADRHRQMAVQLGAKGYFTKPYLEEALLDAAQRMLKGEVLVTKSANRS